MLKRVELDLLEPIYSTYHAHGPGIAITKENPSIRNWYLNHVMQLTCTRNFLKGKTTPELNVVDSSWLENPYIEVIWHDLKLLKGYVNPIIRELINNGYYVPFNGVDDYYVEGKTWYKERHFDHDGLICGYDQDNKTYCIYAYDSHWKYQKFWTSQKSFNNGIRSMNNQGHFGQIYGIKPLKEKVIFSIEDSIDGIKKYLDSNLELYPLDGDGDVYGIIVQFYIAEYIELLVEGTIKYDRMDRRIMRLIWEHKKCMLERIGKIETVVGLTDALSRKYREIVETADANRLLYAAHRIKRRDNYLPKIKKNLMWIIKKEKGILKDLIKEVEGSKNVILVGDYSKKTVEPPPAIACRKYEDGVFRGNCIAF